MSAEVLKLMNTRDMPVIERLVTRLTPLIVPNSSSRES